MNVRPFESKPTVKCTSGLNIQSHVEYCCVVCLTGAQIEETWEEATRSMKKSGVGIGVINVNRSPRLADTLGVGRVPSIIGVINGYVSFYSGTVTVQGLKDFVIGLFPSDLIERVNNLFLILIF